MKKPPISTVAMTAYNWIAIQDGGRTLGEITDGCKAGWWQGTTEEMVAQALAVLLSRKYVTFKDAKYNVRDSQRRVVISRDKKDPTGWSGWSVAKRAPQRRVLLDTQLDTETN